MKRTFIIHPFLFALFPILAFFAHNIEELSPSIIIVPSVVIIFLSVMAWVLLSAILKNTIKAALIISLSVMMFFSYGHFINPIIDFKLYGILIGRHVYFLPIWSMISIGGIYLILKTDKSFNRFTPLLNIVSAFLVMIPFVQIGRYEIKTRALRDYSKEYGIIEEENVLIKKEIVSRDIYYIIFDEYASNKTLRDYYNYDNSGFTNYLTEKGFYVAYDSRANYPSTFLSLASSLNMKYLNYLAQVLGEDSTDKTQVNEMIKNDKVTQLLKAIGYKYIHFGSWWEPTRISKYADINVNYGIPLSEFFTKLFTNTMIYPIIAKYQIELIHKERVLYKFERLKEIPDIEGPKFIFVHFIMPHGPYIFDRDGSKPKILGNTRREQEQNYLDQLIFTTKQIQKLINTIIAKSNKPPIIIIQSDHGPRMDKIIDNNGFIIESVRKRTEILNAYYFPDVSKDIFYPSISPVNTFRIMFNVYFNGKYKILNDESYMSTDHIKYPFRFVNVTSIVK